METSIFEVMTCCTFWLYDSDTIGLCGEQIMSTKEGEDEVLMT